MSSFSFGKPASTGASGGSLFGSSNQNTSNTGSGGGLFGNVGASTSGTSSPSLFGTSSGQGQSPLFSNAAQNQSGSGAAQGQSPLFGGGGAQNQSGTSSSLFGTASQTPNKPNEPSGAGQASSGGLFGKPGGSGGGLFGGNAATPGPAGGGSMFGNQSTTPAGPPPQGGAAGQGQSLLGQAGQKPGGLFGDLNTTSSSTTPSTTAPASGGSLFGGASQQPPSGGLFGSAPQQKPTSTFGTTPAPSGGGLFSNVNKDKPTESTTPAATAGGDAKPLFGTTPAPSAGGTQPGQTSSLFKPAAPGADSASKPAFPSLGSTATTQPSTTPATSTTATQPSTFPSFGGTTASAAPSSTPAAAPSGPNLFGGPKSTATTTSGTAATAPSAPASQPGAAAGGLFGKPAESAPSTQPPSTSATTGAGTTPAATSTAGPTTSTAAATAGATAGTTAGATNLGASTTGPAPPAQSRLKNKTMDEIITRWATDLTKYQKDFREQAERVAEWDRMVVENANKMQKLYGSTVDADRSTQEVERQLASVEGQQEELGSWLDRYEHEVDEMMSKQVGPGESLQGPDQERERTYKLAEKLSDRLDDVGKDLTAMIEEVNGASATLSKTSKADEPLSQIVRILNAHLSQLQVIDQGTSDLQAKVVAAQKAGQTLSSRFGNGLRSSGLDGSSSAADDFYRSFMGRR